MTTVFFSLGYSGVSALKRAAQEQGAGEAEMAAIERLYEGTALAVDVERLEPLAKLAGLDWSKLFPEVFAKYDVVEVSANEIAPDTKLVFFQDVQGRK